MIVVSRFDIVASHINEIVNDGYGFSVLGEIIENEQYARDDYIDILSDWGWSGDKSKKPSWL